MSYAHKLLALTIGAFLMALIAYQFSIKKTITVYRTLNEKREAVEMANNAESQIQHLQSKLTDWEQSIHQNPSTGQDIFDAISAFCNEKEIEIVDFPKLMVHQEEEFKILTNKMTLSSPYHALVELTHYIEEEHQMGRISAVNFYTAKDRKTKSTKLYAELYIQNILNQ